MTRLLYGYINSNETLAQLQDHAMRLYALQRILATGLPTSLQSACQIANIKENELVITTESSAVAVRLKQMTPTLVTHFNQAGHTLSTIKIKIMPSKRAAYPSSPVQTNRYISTTAKTQIMTFAASLPADSDLRIALERLAHHSK